MNRGRIYSVGGIKSIVEPPNTLTSGYQMMSCCNFSNLLFIILYVGLERNGASKDEWQALAKTGITLHAPREPAKAIRLKE